MKQEAYGLASRVTSFVLFACRMQTVLYKYSTMYLGIKGYAVECQGCLMVRNSQLL